MAIQWDSKQAGRLPQAVKIALAVADESGREHRYATTVPVVCRSDLAGTTDQDPGRTTMTRNSLGYRQSGFILIVVLGAVLVLSGLLFGFNQMAAPG